MPESIIEIQYSELLKTIFTLNISGQVQMWSLNEYFHPNLKKIDKLKFISLAKFTNICLELDLLEYLPATLKRLGKGAMMYLPAAMYRFSESLQEINPAFPKSNQIVH